MLSVIVAANSKSGSAVGNLFFFAIIGVVLIMVMRASRKRQRVAQEVGLAVVAGAEVVTAGGQFGTVTDVADGVVHLEIAPGVVVRYVVGAIARVISSPALLEDEEGATDASSTEA